MDGWVGGWMHGANSATSATTHKYKRRGFGNKCNKKKALRAQVTTDYLIGEKELRWSLKKD